MKTYLVWNPYKVAGVLNIAEENRIYDAHEPHPYYGVSGMTLEAHFEWLHKNPPAAFNPEFNPKSVDWFREVAHSMEMDGFYDGRSREECSIEFRRRYDILKAGGVL